MENLTLVAAIDKNLAIGYKGELLVRIKSDLKHFKELTLGQRVIYGKNTLLTFPNAKPLKGRENVILAPADFVVASEAERPCQVYHSLAELETYLASCDDKLVNFGIGGASVYAQLLPFATALELTEIDHAFEEADTYFPDFRLSFIKTECTDYMLGTETNLQYRYVRYERVRR